MLAQELRKPVIKKFKERKVYLRLRDLAADLAEIILLSSFNRGVKYLFCVINVCTKYVWVKILMNKKVETVLDGFIKIVNKYKRKPNKLWIVQWRAVYNNTMHKWYDDNDVLIYSKYNEGKSVVAKGFVRNSNCKIDKNDS